MRASRLLQILLLLQNRGRLTTGALARELEVAQRTIIRDVDALTEAGLPVVVHRGQRGGIELGFNYRTRLTGLAADEAEALGVILSAQGPMVASLGMDDAARRACRKLLESMPDQVRERAQVSASRFRATPSQAGTADPRLPALATAIRESRIVRIRAYRTDERVVHPVALVLRDRWWLEDDRAGELVSLDECADINISSRTFDKGGGEKVPATRTSAGR